MCGRSFFCFSSSSASPSEPSSLFIFRFAPRNSSVSFSSNASIVSLSALSSVNESFWSFSSFSVIFAFFVVLFVSASCSSSFIDLFPTSFSFASAFSLFLSSSFGSLIFPCIATCLFPSGVNVNGSSSPRDTRNALRLLKKGPKKSYGCRYD